MSHLPHGNITLADLAQDIAERTQPAGRQNGQKRPRKAEEGFPLDILPPKLQELAKGAETALGMPSEFMAAACLLAVAAAAGGTYQLQIKRGTVCRPIFFLALVGRPNVNKSGPLKFAFTPIARRDGEQFDEYRRQKAEYDALAGMSKKERREEGITELPPLPVFRQAIVNDATPEALAAVHFANPRGVTVVRDELAGWVKSFDRYNSGGETEAWLSIWNGDGLTINRKTSEPLHLKATNISVVGTIQPAVIEELTAGGKGVNGFIDRLIFAWPDDLEKPEWTEGEINAPLVEAYHFAIERLLDLSFTESGANTLTLDPDAKARLFRFFNKENKPLCDRAENELLAGIYGKFDVHTARLVIVFHLLHWAYCGEGRPPENITLATVERAIKAAEYFRRQSLKVFNRLHNYSPVDGLTMDKRKLYEALPERFQKLEGLAISKKLGVHEKTFSRLLNDKTLFEKIRHGEYGKLF